MSAATFRMYGLRFRSAVPLPGVVACQGSGPTIDVVWGLGEPPSEMPAGAVLAAVEGTGGRRSLLRLDRGDGHLLRFHGVCDFYLAQGLDRVRVLALGGRDNGLVPVLLKSSVPAYLLALRGEVPVHGAAVELEGRAVAFVGSSGMGKSSLSAAACDRGARLVTDDVLRIHHGRSGPCVYRGGAHVRLRPGNGAVFPTPFEAARDWTADGRLAVALPATPNDPVPLDAIVVLGAHEWAGGATPVAPAEALRLLVAHPRAVGWLTPDHRRRAFEQAATLVRDVPVLSVGRSGAPPARECLPRMLESLYAPHDRRRRA